MNRKSSKVSVHFVVESLVITFILVNIFAYGECQNSLATSSTTATNDALNTTLISTTTPAIDDGTI